MENGVRRKKKSKMSSKSVFGNEKKKWPRNHSRKSMHFETNFKATFSQYEQRASSVRGYSLTIRNVYEFI